MVYASRLDEFGKPAWIAAVVFGFWAFWPLGLAVLLYLALSGRLREWRMESRGFWRNMQSGKNGRPGGRMGRGRSSGNHAFDAYRSETIQRLEDEQREFAEYLERLRQARDKAEFDQFMAERRKRPETESANAVM